jgi:hypothetical protein
MIRIDFFCILVYPVFLVYNLKEIFLVIVADGDLLLPDFDKTAMDVIDLPDIHHKTAVNTDEIGSDQLFLDGLHARQRNNGLVSGYYFYVILKTFDVLDLSNLNLDQLVIRFYKDILG